MTNNNDSVHESGRCLKLFSAAKRSVERLILGKAAVMATAVFCAALSVALVFSTSFVCYAVSYDGEDLGRSGSRSELIAAVESAERQASEILGEDMSLTDKLTITADFGSGGDSVTALSDSILGTVDGISRMYAITVDGVPVCAAESADGLRDILRDILSEYVTENTVSVSFKQKVLIENTFVSEDLKMEPEDILALLRPENDDSQYSLSVITVESKAVEGTVGYETEYIYDSEKYSDEVTLERSGSDGVKTDKYLVWRENGVMTCTLSSGSAIITPAVNEIISIGAIEGSRTDSKGYYIWPTEGTITSHFGYRTGGIGSTNHQGIDIANDRGTDILAADGGTVIFAGWASGYGRLIKIQHDNGDVTCYGHLSEFLVSEGDKVAQGDVIGLMGSSGVSSGPHLHFEVRPGGGDPVDPLDYLD